VEEDQAGAAIGGDAGNIFAKWPGRPDLEPLFFSAHMDRVANPGKIKAVVRVEEDRITSDGQTILGADDVSGLVAILNGLRLVAKEGAAHGDVEIVFSVAEEVGLKGARRFDVSRLKSKTGYILDCSGELGTLVNRAPTQKTIDIKVYGLSSHAGMAPEKGVNAIRVGAVAMSRLKEGRLSPITTSNFGIIHGGKATNIVCDYVEITAEARSHDEDELLAYLNELKETFQNTAQEFGAKVEIAVNHEYSSFYVLEDDPVIARATQALNKINRKVKILTGGGGMDGNIFNEKGVKCVGLATGYDYVHTEREEQSIAQLFACGQLVAEIVKSVAQ
jgi:tripeptide aminopeptidase